MPCRSRLLESFPRCILCNKLTGLLHLLESTHMYLTVISELAGLQKHAQTMGGEGEPARSLFAIGGP